MPSEIHPGEIIAEINPDSVPSDQPPGDSNYRPADVAGISCASCVKFEYTGVIEEKDGMIPTGICSLYEAKVRGDYVSDSFVDDSPPIDENGEDIWEFSDKNDVRFAELHFAGTETKEGENGYVRKTILRTGTFPAIPVKGGIIKKPLIITKDGVSDPDKGIISLQELHDNFYKQAVPNVQVPLSDDEYDHKNTTKVNTGFVRGLKIEPNEAGEDELVADIEFTEPEVREKALRGTYADVSSGIPWKLRSRGKDYGACLEHVAITNRPFIPGLGPFLQASEQVAADRAQILHFADSTVVVPVTDLTPPAETQEEETETEPDAPVNEEVAEVVVPDNASDQITEALITQLGLNRDYLVGAVGDMNVTIDHSIANTSWEVPFEVNDGRVKLASIDQWKRKEEDAPEDSAEEAVEPPAPRTELSELENARRLREQRLAEGNSNTTSEANMPMTREELARLELSDEDRAGIEALITEAEEAGRLRKESQKTKAEARVAELSDMGFKEYPGALKLYKRVFEAEDGGAAAVLLSDEGTQEKITALGILDGFIEAVTAKDGKVHLSDQVLLTDPLNDEKPPVTAEGETKSEDERFADAKAALGR